MAHAFTISPAWHAYRPLISKNHMHMHSFIRPTLFGYIGSRLYSLRKSYNHYSKCKLVNIINTVITTCL